MGRPAARDPLEHEADAAARRVRVVERNDKVGAHAAQRSVAEAVVGQLDLDARVLVGRRTRPMRRGRAGQGQGAGFGPTPAHSALPCAAVWALTGKASFAGGEGSASALLAGARSALP